MIREETNKQPIALIRDLNYRNLWIDFKKTGTIIYDNTYIVKKKTSRFKLVETVKELNLKSKTVIVKLRIKIYTFENTTTASIYFKPKNKPNDFNNILVNLTTLNFNYNKLERKIKSSEFCSLLNLSFIFLKCS